MSRTLVIGCPRPSPARPSLLQRLFCEGIWKSRAARSTAPALIVLALLFARQDFAAAENTRPEPIKIGYASISGNRISFWAAQDAGFFARYGLAPELVFIATSAQGLPALLAGDLAMFVGSPETAAQAAVRGVDLIVVSSSEPTPDKL